MKAPEAVLVSTQDLQRIINEAVHRAVSEAQSHPEVLTTKQAAELVGSRRRAAGRARAGHAQRSRCDDRRLHTLGLGAAMRGGSMLEDRWPKLTES